MTRQADLHSYFKLSVWVTKPDYSALSSITATSVRYNIEDETITLEFPELLHVGTSWILDIVYIGLVNDKLNGFYRSVYTDADNNVQ